MFKQVIQAEGKRHQMEIQISAKEWKVPEIVTARVVQVQGFFLTV